MNHYVKSKYEPFICRIKGIFKKIGMVTRSGRRCSKTTHKERYDSIISSANILYAHGYHIKHPTSLKVKHLHCLFDNWLDSNLSAGRIQNLMSHWRFFLTGINKPDLITQAEHHYLRIDDLNARKRRLRKGEYPDRSWTGSNVEFTDVFKNVFNDESCVAIQLLAQGTFGMRVNESWNFKPHLADNGDTISILTGAKGGRRRSGVKPITLNDQGREVMALFKTFVGTNPSNSLTPPEYTVKRWKYRYYNILQKHGVTKKELGVTSHGLRHEYGQTMFEIMLDEKAAISKKLGHAMTPQERKDYADQVITECLGHARKNIKGVYGV